VITYNDIDDPEGVNGTSITLLSGDGSTVVGDYTDIYFENDPFVSTVGSGDFTDVSDPNGSADGIVFGDGTGVNAINGDGSMVAGYYSNIHKVVVGFVEDVATGTYSDVQDPNATSLTSVYAISADGLVVAGSYSNDTGDHGFVENRTTGVFTDVTVANGQGTEIRAVSADGGYLAGYYSDNSGTYGFVDNIATGAYTRVADPNAAGLTVATSVSDNGAVVAGYYFNGGLDKYVGFVENVATGVFKDVLDPNGYNLSIDNVLSANGEFVAGSYDDAVTGLGTGFIEDLATGVYTEISDPNGTAGGSHVTAISADGATVAGSYFNSADDEIGFVAHIACYGRGVSILTTRGEVAVETLAVGDLVVTASGQARPIKWVGHRLVDCARHPDPGSVWPVRVSAGAFGQDLPRRDLWLSPGHNIAFEGALIEARRLVNGRSVVQVERDRIEYWHIELDAHDVIYAEGLPAETYLDTGNRTAFANGGAFVEAHPDFRPRHWSQTCLPQVFGGPQLVRARSRLLERLETLEEATTAEAELHVVADGARIAPTKLGAKRFAFLLPDGRRRVQLASRTFIPAHVGAESADFRTLGLCVGRLQIDGEEIALDDTALFTAGWHKKEPGQCWTNGAAALPARSRLVVIDLAGEGRYWRTPVRPAKCAAPSSSS
jgi:hypothetical protein